MEEEIGDNLSLQIAQIYGDICDEKNMLAIHKVNVQQQSPGSVNCGLFALAFAVEVCFGKDPSSATFNESKLGIHLSQCFEKGVIRRFPQMRKQSKVERPNNNLIVSLQLYCKCKMPEHYDNMVECEKCKEWLHQACVGFSSRQSRKVKWYCTECKGK